MQDVTSYLPRATGADVSDSVTQCLLDGSTSPTCSPENPFHGPLTSWVKCSALTSATGALFRSKCTLPSLFGRTTCTVSTYLEDWPTDRARETSACALASPSSWSRVPASLRNTVSRNLCLSCASVSASRPPAVGSGLVTETYPVDDDSVTVSAGTFPELPACTAQTDTSHESTPSAISAYAMVEKPIAAVELVAGLQNCVPYGTAQTESPLSLVILT